MLYHFLIGFLMTAWITAIYLNFFWCNSSAVIESQFNLTNAEVSSNDISLSTSWLLDSQNLGFQIWHWG